MIEIIKMLDLVLGNNGNNLTTTTRDMLNSAILKLKLDVGSTFEMRREQLFESMKEDIKNLIAHNGVDSKQFSDKVLIPDDDFMSNIDCYPQGYVTEVSAEQLISSKGHQYSYDTLSMEEICCLIDHLKEKYED